MLLTYSKPEFEEAILSGTKIHTIREDKTNRWEAGMLIHHWLYNPRNKKQHPDAHEFLKNQCVSVQRIDMYRHLPGNTINDVIIYVDFKRLDDDEIIHLCKNDGLTWPEFLQWFLPNLGDILEDRKIIHWTDLKY